MSKDYYAVLGVKKEATQDEVKKAFRRLAHEHHPDKGGDQQKFKDINEAYQVVGDEAKRKKYDQFGSAAFEQQGAPGGPGGFGGFDGGFSMNMEDLGDMFGDMFGFGGQRNARGGQRRGNDIQTEVTIDFLESVKGVTKRVSLYVNDKCGSCEGSGAKQGTSRETCKTCNGQGAVRQSARTMFGTIQTNVTCPECAGIGSRPKEACGTCKGLGIERKTKELDIPIPGGIDDGEAVRVSGGGEYPGANGVAGDLYVRARVKSHSVFTRDGLNVLSTVHIPFSMFALGGEIEIDTVDGKGTLKIPEATDPGTVFQIRHKGFPSTRSGNRGDQLVTIAAEAPRKLNRDQRKLLEQMRDAGL